MFEENFWKMSIFGVRRKNKKKFLFWQKMIENWKFDILGKYENFIAAKRKVVGNLVNFNFGPEENFREIAIFEVMEKKLEWK